MKLISTVVIPAYNRQKELDRAIDSVLKCKGSEFVEIIVVDDNSESLLEINKKRTQDKIIRNEYNKGAAVSRNIGIKNSKTKIIYLLDNDDYFIERDFIKDAKLISKSKPAIYYTNIKSGILKRYPNEINKQEFFNYIFNKHENIGQTSSLILHKDTNILFDEALPKHQDWDLLYSALKQGISIKKIDGEIFFDKSDKKSLSRRPVPEKSDNWYEKLKQDFYLESKDLDEIEFHLYSKYTSRISWRRFFKQGTTLIIQRKMNLKRYLKTIIQRVVK